MNYKTLRITAAAVLCCLIVGGSAGVYAAARANDGGGSSLFSDVEASPAPVQEAPQQAAEDISANNVYIIAGAGGDTKKVIVTDSIKSRLGAGSGTVYDVDGNKVAGVEDVCASLPVSLSINYTLNGVSVTPEELTGKSGSVTIRIDYENTRAEQHSINGRQETLYSPYIALTAMALDSDVFSNVSITNGSLVNDGSRTVAAGLAFPGLAESLNIDNDKLDIPGYMEISANVKKFDFDGTYTIVTNEPFREASKKEKDEDILDADELSDSMDELSDAMDKLMDGSDELYDGLRTLLDKSYELVDGINRLADGAYELYSGAAKLDSGAGELYGGASELSGGLSRLASNNAELNGGAKKVFDSLLSTATEQLRAAGIDESMAPDLTIENYGKVLASLSGGMSVSRDEIQVQVEAAVRQEVLGKVLEAQGIDKDTYSALPDDDPRKAAIDAAVDAQMQSEAVQAQIEKITEEKYKAASQGAGQIQALKAQLDEYNKFYTGLNDYTAGVSEAQAGAAKLAGGAAELKSGTAQLYSGTAELYSGVKKMQDSTPELIDGVQKLTDGAKELHNGIVKLNDEGIQKIIDAFDGDLSGLSDRLKALRDMADSELTLGGLKEQPRFIYKSEGCGAD